MTTTTANAMPLSDLLELRLDDPTPILQPSTVVHYHRCLRQYGQHLGRRPTTDDLNAKSLVAWAKATIEEGRASETANARLKQLRALWEWAVRNGYVDKWPPRRLKMLGERRIPDSWTGEELAALFESAGKQRGTIGPHWADEWFSALLWVAYNTGERAGALFGLEPDMVNIEEGWIEAPARIRKATRMPMRWWLSKRGHEAIARLHRSSRHVLFGYDWRDWRCVYKPYRQLLQDAGLATGRRQGLQKIRRTVASRIKLRGGDPALWLGHAPRSVSSEHYEDRWLCQTQWKHVWPTDDLYPTNVDADGQRRFLFKG